MPPRFRKSPAYLLVPAHVETEVLDAYADVLTAANEPDLVLQNMPDLLRRLDIPACFTRDICQCVEWFYATQQTTLARASLKWAVAEQLLQHLTISLTIRGRFDVSDIVDIDKLVKFCNRLVKFRDNHLRILQNWALFVDASGGTDGTSADHCLTLPDLVKIKSSLQLDDIGDSILIDMLGCSRSSVDGDLFNYKLSAATLEVGIKDFAEVLGLLGEYD
ncbi:hypothetical protein METBIDRAFT_39917 [Metschnikowia bicuspidata var. bicuspidata NRRL YB-4993]|uniref:Uncharacterized protein n=1 Tax=Metschnikowia bicuspidata var. bicuspidata NRRL YB-4993 TaxID=869754 RepID=A0A1A0HEM8_9ASCO|nr:hypothetical protein METBIDRAFT_39917 [Metschnikowia bicuspidata var. bicuspidata NRRL YB-4993]OBA22456.1 hypothetical protein METBIDRAFT_39917 [Metschnikowia bicuspidata var. bicuspidata NRRL YB-4993]